MSLKFVIFVSMLVAANAQRSPYAGSRPGSGYKDRFVPSSGQTTDTLAGNDVVDRIGSTGDAIPTTTVRLPYDALGDAFIVNHWNSLPIDQRPFWIVNQQHIESHRGTPSRPSAGSIPQTTVSRPQNNDDIVNRFGVNQPNPTQNINSGINTISQQEVVYPSNITPEQRLQMQIIVAQNHLAALQEQQRQQQLAQQQGQLTTQQINLASNRNNRNPDLNIVRSRRAGF